MKESYSSKTISSLGGSFSFSCADESPLSQEQQLKLRSKYLFDDEEEEKKPPKRNMIRSQSLITSRNHPEKTSHAFFDKSEMNFTKPSSNILKSAEKVEPKKEVIARRDIGSGRSKVSNNLPPKCPLSLVSKKETNFSIGIF